MCLPARWLASSRSQNYQEFQNREALLLPAAQLIMIAIDMCKGSLIDTATMSEPLTECALDMYSRILEPLLFY
jgi:hypothetical protein